jgi:L-aspartate oxidase
MHTQTDDRRYLIPFRAALLPQIFTDVLVIGSGVAGLRAALAASRFADVIVTSKGDLSQSNTYHAQGGIAAVLGDSVPERTSVQGHEVTVGGVERWGGDTPGDDSPALHARDTIRAGAGLCDEAVVWQTVQAGPERIRELIDWGIRFDRAGGEVNSVYAQGKEGGHSTARVLHTDGDATGVELVHTLGRCVHACDRVRLFEDCFVLDLLTEDGPTHGAPGRGRCLGAITHHPRYGLQVIWAGATILASGGCGQVYRESTNPTSATGDGLAAAYRAGAKLADMAFVQFHPTTLYVAGAARSLITEAVRGEGALLLDRDGYRFMPDYDKQAELAPRDIVSRAIITQMAKTHFTHVYLDCRPIGGQRFAKRFPGIQALLEQFGLDPAKDPIPIHPSAHYMVGGVHTDDHGRTGIHGLYACGETACTGLNGANRLASNSLLEGLVFGELAGRTCQEALEPDGSGAQAGGRTVKIVSDIRPSDRSWLDLADVRSSQRSVMWRHVGIEREGDRLAEVAEMIDFWARYTLDKIFDDRAGWEVQNMLQVGAMITRSARWRCESRGTHHRTDHPQPDEQFYRHDLWQRGRSEPETITVRIAETPAITT